MAAAPAGGATGGVGTTTPACANWWCGAILSSMSSTSRSPTTAAGSTKGRSPSVNQHERALSMNRKTLRSGTGMPARRYSKRRC
eukprot:5900085-Alexandrium_andersonii.AAC.1